MQNTNQVNPSPVVHTLDLNFLGIPGAIACYLIPHAGGAVLIECGPGSTIPALQAGLRAFGLTEKDVTDVLLTHIHLDHAGAAGWLAQQGARIHVHPIGAGHLLDPQKLLASAGRIYGDQMETLWGKFLPVPAGNIHILDADEVLEIGGLRIRPLDTPGHANHHYAYLFNGTCFSGDILGVRMAGQRHLRLPMPPPEFNLEKWNESLAYLQSEFKRCAIHQIAPTHFGIFNDPAWHLASVSRALKVVGTWIEENLPGEPNSEELVERFLNWKQQHSQAEGLPPEMIKTYESVNPSWMSVAGLQRYWKKHRLSE
jgi:glyoxylase-like metal-dependent hydrolase (beta-lactamase superfamily II)